MNTTAYLERIGYIGSIEPTLETLSNLHEAHLRTVPFETLDLHLGISINLETVALECKIVQNRRGGWCYELNALFAELLHTLGFDVRLKMCQPTKGDGTLSPAFGHLALKVLLEGQEFLVDVGFGQDFRDPLELCEGVQGECLLERDDHFWLYSRRTREGDWKLQFRIDPEEYALEDFLEMCNFYQHSSESGFRKHSFCGVHTSEGYSYLSDRTLTLEGKVRKSETVLEPGEIGPLLLERFGVDLSEGQLERLRGTWRKRGV